MFFHTESETKHSLATARYLLVATDLLAQLLFTTAAIILKVKLLKLYFDFIHTVTSSA